MKKIIYLLLVSALLFSLFSACEDKDKNIINNEILEDTIPSHSNEPTYNILDDNKTIDSELVFFANFDLFRVADNNTSNTLNLISYVKNQEYMSVRDNWGTDYIWLNSDFENKFNNLTSYTIEDYYDKNSSMFNKEIATNILFKSNETYNIATKVLYTSYPEGTVCDNELWNNYFKLYISDTVGISESPIIIKESWSFDFEGDTAYIVTISNIAKSDNLEIFKPENNMHSFENYGDNPIQYSITALFTPNNEPINLTQPYLYKHSYPNPIPETHYVIPLYILQYDENENIIKKPYFTDPNYIKSSLELLYEPSFLILDIDKDSENEIVCYYNSGYSELNSITYYDFDNGKLNEHLAFAGLF